VGHKKRGSLYFIVTLAYHFFYCSAVKAVRSSLEKAVCPSVRRISNFILCWSNGCIL